MLSLGAMLIGSGTHWVALQALAFGTMVVRYAQEAPWSRAVSMTFDGRHPCALCHVVQNGQQQDRQQSATVNAGAERELSLPEPSAGEYAPSTAWLPLRRHHSPPWHPRTLRPPKPPPRHA